jgi:hypothetical protein
MPLFLITFLSMYGCLHAFAFMRLRTAFGLNQFASRLLAVLMGAMTFAPLVVRLSESAGLERTAILIAWPAYLWMGSIFIFCSFLFALDVIRAAFWLIRRFSVSVPSHFVSGTAAVKISLLSAIMASCYAMYEARAIRTEHVTITSAKLSPQAGKLRIVQISDVHLGLLFRETRLESVLQAVRDAHPDILVSTGDLVDGRLSREDVISKMGRLAAMIASTPTRAGKYAIAGNHEFYAGIGPSVDFMKSAGFTVLRNRSVQLPEGLTISGVDDPGRGKEGKALTLAVEAEMMKTVPVDRFHVLLKHRPNIPASSDGRFDLQLSGHVHKGQLFPFNLLVLMKFPIPCGTTLTPAGSRIHVSRGSGTWGPPMRFLAPPEVTVIDILPSAKSVRE